MLSRKLLSSGRTPTLLAGGLLLGGILVALLGCGLDSPALIIIGLLASLLGEFPLREYARDLNTMLRNASVGYTTRLLVRVALALAFTLGSGRSPWLPLLLCAAVVVVRAADVVLASVLRHRSATLIRNVAAVADGNAQRTPGILVGSEIFRALPTELLVLSGLITLRFSLATGIVLGVAGLGYGLALVLASAALIRARPKASANAAFQRAIDSCAPTVVLHFSGGLPAIYQLNMWLATLERMDERVLILLRENEVFQAMDPTSVATICVPKGPDLLTLQFPTVRVALYVANVGNNIHFLRLPHIKSVFIGHGDSDKNASFNPYSRVYSEVWVAGRAGRDRYQRADVGIRDEDVHEVGRPQAAILAQPAAERKHAIPTVLYAPTWEGWNDDQNYCSVSNAGLAFVEHVLKNKLPIRLIYRPHPLIGTRSAKVRRAHERITALLDSSNAQRGLRITAPSAIRAAANASGSEDALLARDRAFFENINDSAHVSLEPGWKVSLVGSMLASDAMLTDISSVLSDFVATGKPFAVTNPLGTPAAEFIQDFPSASAGPLLGPRGEGRDEFLQMLSTTNADDPYARQRTDLRTYLLGTSPQNAQSTFNQAVDRLIRIAESRQHDATPVVEASEVVAGLQDSTTSPATDGN